MHLLYFIKVQLIKNFFKKKKIFVITHRFESYRGTEFYRLQEADKGRKVLWRFLQKEIFAVENNFQ